LILDALHHAFATFGALMSPDLPLERRQHEMIATMVSLTNQVPLLNRVSRRVPASDHPGRRARAGASRGPGDGPGLGARAHDARLRGQADEGRHAGLPRRPTPGSAPRASTTAASSRSP
jgi:hypothetical protein